MEHSKAIMEDAGAAIEAAVQQEPTVESSSRTKAAETRDERSSGKDGGSDRRKRKGDFGHSRMYHGSRGRNAGHDDKQHKKGDLGRVEYFREVADKRRRTQDSREKRDVADGPRYGKSFPQEEIDANERRPKRKVAVMIGYSGTGYKGMQISPSEKTIEGDLFNAFIAAGAISKANADDPKKSSLVRCARTDKGVHAAGNMISLKLIVEDEDIVQKINDNLSPQIRVWGIERTIGSFSCYQAVDSRWYEYLIPTHAFLPPHPSSWMAKKIDEYAGEGEARAAHDERQEEVKGFWENIDETEIKPILETIDEDIRWDVIKALRGEDEANAIAAKMEDDAEQPVKVGKSHSKTDEGEEGEEEGAKEDGEKTEEAAIIIQESNPAVDSTANGAATNDERSVPTNEGGNTANSNIPSQSSSNEQTDANETGVDNATSEARSTKHHLTPEEAERLGRLRAAARKLRSAYTAAKRRYRIPEQRIKRIQSALNKYVGTVNYHNYTIQKSYRDPSAKRHIKSFVVNPKPILIGEGDDVDKSEWLSMKVHGQSFMMHQIRKMVGMVSLMVRCGSDLSTMEESFGKDRFSIPKVPGLGLLLERPVFDSYNKLQAAKHDRPALLFSKYDEELQAFKEREIYQRIFREEEERNEFSKFYNHVDNFKDPAFLYVTGRGLTATNGWDRKAETNASEETDAAKGGETLGEDQ